MRIEVSSLCAVRNFSVFPDTVSLRIATVDENAPTTIPGYLQIMPFETQKSYYSIGEVSRIAGVPAYLLRYWESFFTELNPSRDTRGNRRYTNRDISMVLNIKELVYDKGYKLGRASELVKADAPENDSDRKTAEILKLRKQIERDQKKSSTVDDRRRVLLEEIRDEVEDLLQMLG